MTTATVTGLLSPKDLLAAMDEVGRRTPSNELLLLDLQGLPGPISDALQALLGHHVGGAVKHARKTAVLLSPQHLSGVVESASRRTGAIVREFVDLEEARDWLLH